MGHQSLWRVWFEKGENGESINGHRGKRMIVWPIFLEKAWNLWRNQSEGQTCCTYPRALPQTDAAAAAGLSPLCPRGTAVLFLAALLQLLSLLMVLQHACATLTNDSLDFLHWSDFSESTVQKEHIKYLPKQLRCSEDTGCRHKNAHVSTNTQMCWSEAVQQRTCQLAPIFLVTDGTGLKHTQTKRVLFTAFFFLPADLYHSKEVMTSWWE